MENEKRTDAAGLPPWMEQQLRFRSANPPAFDPAWLEQEPTRHYAGSSGGKVLAFPSRMLLAAAASVLIALGILYVVPYFQGTTSTDAEIFASATGTGVTIQGTEAPGSGWNLGRIQPGSTIDTGEETLDLISSTGVILRLYPSSELTLESAKSRLVLRQHRGRMLVEVRPREGGSDVRLTVHTPQSRVEVTGTVFSLDVDAEESRLYLQEGELNMSDQAVQAGELARKPANSALIIKEEPAQSEPLEAELADLRRSTDELARQWIPEMKRLDKVREETQIKEMYGQSLEKIILKDGRILQGVVASQQGDRLLLHTTTGVVVVRRQDIQEILYEN